MVGKVGKKSCMMSGEEGGQGQQEVVEKPRRLREQTLTKTVKEDWEY